MGSWYKLPLPEGSWKEEGSLYFTRVKYKQYRQRAQGCLPGTTRGRGEPISGCKQHRLNAFSEQFDEITVSFVSSLRSQSIPRIA